VIGDSSGDCRLAIEREVFSESPMNHSIAIDTDHAVIANVTGEAHVVEQS
jgi:hypothetical protein